VNGAERLTALARLNELLEANEIEYWVFGGWAVDFHAGSVTQSAERAVRDVMRTTLSRRWQGLTGLTPFAMPR
jgi:hypothetical protein